MNAELPQSCQVIFILQLKVQDRPQVHLAPQIPVFEVFIIIILFL